MVKNSGKSFCKTLSEPCIKIYTNSTTVLTHCKKVMNKGYILRKMKKTFYSVWGSLTLSCCTDHFGWLWVILVLYGWFWL